MLHRYFALHKPYGMLSQFTGGDRGLRMLSDLDETFPEGTNAVGRLDYTSEGLLLLSTDARVTKRLFDPGVAHPRTYLVNVHGQVSEDALDRLREGIAIGMRGAADHVTAPAAVVRVARPPGLPRNTHELRADIRQDWLEITLTEGKNRQVRKMLQAAGHACHRLIRTRIGGMALGDLPAGSRREFSEAEFFRELGI